MSGVKRCKTNYPVGAYPLNDMDVSRRLKAFLSTKGEAASANSCQIPVLFSPPLPVPSPAPLVDAKVLSTTSFPAAQVIIGKTNIETASVASQDMLISTSNANFLDTCVLREEQSLSTGNAQWMAALLDDTTPVPADAEASGRTMTESGSAAVYTSVYPVAGQYLELNAAEEVQGAQHSRHLPLLTEPQHLARLHSDNMEHPHVACVPHIYKDNNSSHDRCNGDNIFQQLLSMVPGSCGTDMFEDPINGLLGMPTQPQLQPMDSHGSTCTDSSPQLADKPCTRDSTARLMCKDVSHVADSDHLLATVASEMPWMPGTGSEPVPTTSVGQQMFASMQCGAPSRPLLNAMHQHHKLQGETCPCTGGGGASCRLGAQGRLGDLVGAVDASERDSCMSAGCSRPLKRGLDLQQHLMIRRTRPATASDLPEHNSHCLCRQPSQQQNMADGNCKLDECRVSIAVESESSSLLSPHTPTCKATVLLEHCIQAVLRLHLALLSGPPESCAAVDLVHWLSAFRLNAHGDACLATSTMPCGAVRLLSWLVIVCMQPQKAKSLSTNLYPAAAQSPFARRADVLLVLEGLAGALSSLHNVLMTNTEPMISAGVLQGWRAGLEAASAAGAPASIAVAQLAGQICGTALL